MSVLARHGRALGFRDPHPIGSGRLIGFGRPIGSGRLGAILLVLCVMSGCAVGVGPGLTPAPADLPALERQVESDPSDVNSAVRLGIGYRADGRLTEARTTLHRVVRLRPQNDLAVLFLGLTLEDLGLPGLARETYDTYLASGTTGPQAERIRARRSVVRTQELKQAIDASLDAEADLSDLPAADHIVAVFPFEYGGEEERYRPLGRAFSAMLMTDLSQTDRLTVVERLEVNTLVEEIALAGSGRVDPTTAAKGGRLLGAGTVVQGYLDGGVGTPLSVQAGVVQLEQGPQALQSISDEARVNDLFDMQKRVAFSIYESLGIELTASERERINKHRTENIHALLAYGHGLEAEARGDFREATDRFRIASDLDPSFDAAMLSLDRATQAGSAFSSTTQQAAAEAEAESEAPAEATSLVEVDALLNGLDDMVPTGEVRDPIAEVQSPGESLGGLRITIKRPGSGS